MKKKSLAVFLILALCMAMVFTACSATTTTKVTDTSAVSDEPATENTGDAVTTDVPAADAAVTDAPAASLDDSPMWQEIEIGTEAMLDMNCDGAEESIMITIPSEDMLKVEIRSGDYVYTEDFEYVFNVTAYLANVQTSDKSMELVIAGDMGSDDYYTEIFYLSDDGTIKMSEIFGGTLEMPGDGTVLIDTCADVLGTYGAHCVYTKQPDWTFVRTSPYMITMIEPEYMTITLQKDGLTGIAVTNGVDGEEVSYKTGDTFVLVETDGETYVILKDAQDRLVKMTIAQNTESWGWLVNGESESAWFGELRYAG